MTVDHPRIAVFNGLGAKTSQIAAAMGFRKQLAPNFFPAGKLGQVPQLLGLAGIRHQRRRAHALADDEGPAQFTIDPFLLAPDHTFNRCRTATTIFLRPLDAGPTRFGFGFLPFFGLGNRIKIAGPS